MPQNFRLDLFLFFISNLEHSISSKILGFLEIDFKGCKELKLLLSVIS